MNNKKCAENYAGKKFLLVEDNLDSALLMQLYFNTYCPQAKLLSTNTGEDALNIFANNKDISLILMDLSLPNMNGFEATTQIKKISPNTPVIIVSAYADKKHKDMAFEAEADDYITKPCLLNDVFSVLNKYLIK